MSRKGCLAHIRRVLDYANMGEKLDKPSLDQLARETKNIIIKTGNPNVASRHIGDVTSVYGLRFDRGPRYP